MNAKPATDRQYKPKRPAPQFAHWATSSAAALIAPLNLDAEIVGWLTSILRAGEMAGIENITTLANVCWSIGVRTFVFRLMRPGIPSC